MFKVEGMGPRTKHTTTSRSHVQLGSDEDLYRRSSTLMNSKGMRRIIAFAAFFSVGTSMVGKMLAAGGTGGAPVDVSVDLIRVQISVLDEIKRLTDNAKPGTPIAPASLYELFNRLYQLNESLPKVNGQTHFEGLVKPEKINPLSDDVAETTRKTRIFDADASVLRRVLLLAPDAVFTSEIFGPLKGEVNLAVSEVQRSQNAFAQLEAHRVEVERVATEARAAEERKRIADAAAAAKRVTPIRLPQPPPVETPPKEAPPAVADNRPAAPPPVEEAHVEAPPPVRARSIQPQTVLIPEDGALAAKADEEFLGTIGELFPNGYLAVDIFIMNKFLARAEGIKATLTDPAEQALLADLVSEIKFHTNKARALAETYLKTKNVSDVAIEDINQVALTLYSRIKYLDCWAILHSKIPALTFKEFWEKTNMTVFVEYLKVVGDPNDPKRLNEKRVLDNLPPNTKDELSKMKGDRRTNLWAMFLSYKINKDVDFHALDYVSSALYDKLPSRLPDGIAPQLPNLMSDYVKTRKQFDDLTGHGKKTPLTDDEGLKLFEGMRANLDRSIRTCSAVSDLTDRAKIFYEAFNEKTPKEDRIRVAKIFYHLSMDLQAIAIAKLARQSDALHPNRSDPVLAIVDKRIKEAHDDFRRTYVDPNYDPVLPATPRDFANKAVTLLFGNANLFDFPATYNIGTSPEGDRSGQSVEWARKYLATVAAIAEVKHFGEIELDPANEAHARFAAFMLLRSVVNWDATREVKRSNDDSRRSTDLPIPDRGAGIFTQAMDTFEDVDLAEQGVLRGQLRRESDLKSPKPGQDKMPPEVRGLNIAFAQEAMARIVTQSGELSAISSPLKLEKFTAQGYDALVKGKKNTGVAYERLTEVSDRLNATISVIDADSNQPIEIKVSDLFYNRKIKAADKRAEVAIQLVSNALEIRNGMSDSIGEADGANNGKTDLYKTLAVTPTQAAGQLEKALAYLSAENLDGIKVHIIKIITEVTVPTAAVNQSNTKQNYQGTSLQLVNVIPENVLVKEDGQVILLPAYLQTHPELQVMYNVFAFDLITSGGTTMELILSPLYRNSAGPFDRNQPKYLGVVVRNVKVIGGGGQEIADVCVPVHYSNGNWVPDIGRGGTINNDEVLLYFKKGTNEVDPGEVDKNQHRGNALAKNIDRMSTPTVGNEAVSFPKYMSQQFSVFPTISRIQVSK